MVQETVKDLVKRFKASWGAYAARSPVLVLDETWPSVGVLDHLTYPLRGRAELSAPEADLLRGATAYFAVLVHQAWSQLGAQVEVFQGEAGIAIEAREGAGIPAGEKVSLEIEQRFAELHREPPRPLPIIREFSRVVSPYHNHLSLVGLGLMTGLSEWIDGPWKRETVATFQGNLDKVIRELARQSAEYYGRVFPDEPLGQVAELYLHDLIFPPTTMAEDLPVRKAVAGFLDFVENYKIPIAKAQALAYNLAFNPDERISDAGFALVSGMLQSVPTPELIALANSKGTYVGLLRPAMLDVRARLGRSGDWLDATDYSEEHVHRITTELRLGYIPWLKLSRDKVLTAADDRQLASLIAALSGFDFARAKALAQQMVDDDPGDIQLRVQRIYLDLVEGDVERAEAGLKAIMTEPDSESEPAYFNLMGSVQLILGNFQAGEDNFTRAKALASRDPLLATDVANNFAWSQMCKEDFTSALESLDFALQLSPRNLTALLNKASVLHQLGKDGEAREVEAELTQLAPLDRRVVGAMISSGYFQHQSSSRSI